MRSERKLITVLFADIKGSIDLVARHDPEQAGEVLGAVVAEMSAAVRQCGGIVNQIMGDGIMALFGAPLALEDHATQACQAALAMRDAIGAKVRPRVELRVGMSSGEVVVRAVQGDVGLHYSAAGEAVHFASRMEQLAVPGQILLTAGTVQLTGGRAETHSLGLVQVKGLEEPVEVFELARIIPRPARRLGADASFVGREHEMDQLQDAFDHAAAGEPRAIRIIGEAGCGKSRLVREFTSKRLPEDWTVCHAEAMPHRRTSYAAAAELLGSLFGLSADEEAAVRRDKVVAGLGLPESEAEETMLSPLSTLLGLRPPPAWGRLEPSDRRERTIAAVSRAVQLASLRRPLAVVVEDAHWLDPESADALQRLGNPMPGERLLAIATERPPDTPFTDPRSWLECRLGLLDQNATHALLERLVLPGPDVPALERQLLEHTRGNPLFLEACLQSLVDTGELVRDHGRFRLQRAVDRLRVPDSLRGLLDARVDRLPGREKDVLQAASVVGTSVPLPLLQRTVDLAPEELLPVLDRLCADGFLAEAGSFGEVPRYAFRHGLIRDAAYGGMLRRTRVRMHQAVLDAVEASGGAEADAGLLADHATQAEAWPKAVAYSRIAATRAFERYANPESARFYRQALNAASHLPEGADRDQTLLGLNIDIRWPLFRLGHVNALRPHLDQAIELAAELGDYVQLGQSHVLRSHVLWLAGEPEEAQVAAEAARRIARLEADRDLEVRAEFQSALVHLSASRIPEIIAALKTVLDHLGEHPPRSGPYRLDAELAVTALGYLVRAYAAAGLFGEAYAALRKAEALARDMGLRQNWIYVNIAKGVLLTAQNRPHHAAHALEQAYEDCTKADIRLLRPAASGFLALAYAESGRARKGADLAHEAVDEAERMGFFALHPMRIAVQAQAHLLLGNLDTAEAEARRAEELAARIKEPGAGAYATGLRGEVARRRGQEEEAQLLLRAGLEQAERLGLHPLASSLRQRLDHPDDRAHPWLDGIALAP